MPRLHSLLSAILVGVHPVHSAWTEPTRDAPCLFTSLFSFKPLKMEDCVSNLTPSFFSDVRVSWYLSPLNCFSFTSTFWHVVLSFSFSSKSLLISLETATWKHGCLKSRFVNFQGFGDFPITDLWFYQVGSENINLYGFTFFFFNLLSVVLWTRSRPIVVIALWARKTDPSLSSKSIFRGSIL